MIGRLKYDVVIGGGRVLMLNGCPFRMPIDPCGHLNWVLELVQGTKVIRLWPECLVSVEGIFGIRAFVRYWDVNLYLCARLESWRLPISRSRRCWYWMVSLCGATDSRFPRI